MPFYALRWVLFWVISESSADQLDRQTDTHSPFGRVAADVDKVTGGEEVYVEPATADGEARAANDRAPGVCEVELEGRVCVSGCGVSRGAHAWCHG